jgi:hypothetical protein
VCVWCVCDRTGHIGQRGMRGIAVYVYYIHIYTATTTEITTEMCVRVCGVRVTAQGTSGDGECGA